MNSYSELVSEISRSQMLDNEGKKAYLAFAEAFNDPAYDDILIEMAEALRDYRLKKNALDALYYAEVKEYFEDAENVLASDENISITEKEEISAGLEKIKNMYRDTLILDRE